MQCKYYVNSCLQTVTLSLAFWDFLKFSSNIFDLLLVQSLDVETTDMEGQLYVTT